MRRRRRRDGRARPGTPAAAARTRGSTPGPARTGSSGADAGTRLAARSRVAPDDGQAAARGRSRAGQDRRAAARQNASAHRRPHRTENETASSPSSSARRASSSIELGAALRAAGPRRNWSRRTISSISPPRSRRAPRGAAGGAPLAPEPARARRPGRRRSPRFVPTGEARSQALRLYQRGRRGQAEGSSRTTRRSSVISRTAHAGPSRVLPESFTPP